MAAWFIDLNGLKRIHNRHGHASWRWVGQMRAWFQPKISAMHGTIVGGEVLARRQQPWRGVLAPAPFTPLAEAVGLLRELIAAMLRDGCLRIGGCSSGDRSARLPVNISPTSLAEIPWCRRRMCLPIRVPPAIIPGDWRAVLSWESLKSHLWRMGFRC